MKMFCSFQNNNDSNFYASFYMTPQILKYENNYDGDFLKTKKANRQI